MATVATSIGVASGGSSSSRRLVGAGNRQLISHTKWMYALWFIGAQIYTEAKSTKTVNTESVHSDLTKWCYANCVDADLRGLQQLRARECSTNGIYDGNLHNLSSIEIDKSRLAMTPCNQIKHIKYSYSCACAINSGAHVEGAQVSSGNSSIVIGRHGRS